MNSAEETENKGYWLTAAALGIGAIAAYTAWGKRDKNYSFRNKTVLITGGSRGLGLIMARLFANEGAKIAICARDKNELIRAAEELESNGAEVFETVCDVRNQNEVNQLVEKVCSHYEHIDVLVNNAGVIQVGPLEVQTKKDFEDALDVHFWGPYHTMNAVLPKMREQGGGKIVNISSIGGKMAVPHLAPYCASKFALVGLSNAMRNELAKDNIDVTTVCPGLMRTGSHINAIFKGKNKKEFAWFSIANAFPLASINAERAAKEIIEACRKGDSEVIISIQAKLAAKMNSAFPGFIADVNGFVNQMLPSAGGIGKNYATGLQSTSFASPSFLTSQLDKKSRQNNELKPHEIL